MVSTQGEHVFISFRKYSDEERETNLFNLIITMQILFACAIITSKARVGSGFLVGQVHYLNEWLSRLLVSLAGWFRVGRAVLLSPYCQFKRLRVPYLLITQATTVIGLAQPQQAICLEPSPKV